MNDASLTVTEPPTGELVAVEDQCAAIETWAASCDSVPELRDATHKLAAIDEYLSRSSREGRARVAAAMRRLEARVGELLGPTRQGERTDLSGTTEKLSKDNRSDFRLMTAHRDVMEQVIAESSDESPPSRRKVLDAIRSNRLTLTAEDRFATDTGVEQCREVVEDAVTEMLVAIDRHPPWRELSDEDANQLCRNIEAAAHTLIKHIQRARAEHRTARAAGAGVAALWGTTPVRPLVLPFRLHQG